MEKRSYWITDRRETGVTFSFIVRGKELEPTQALVVYLKYFDKPYKKVRLSSVVQDGSWKCDDISMRICPNKWRPTGIDKVINVK